MVVFLLYHAQAQLAYIIKFVDKIFVDCMPALCGNGAERLLENGENLLKMVVQCMDSTQQLSIIPYTIARGRPLPQYPP